MYLLEPVQPIVDGIGCDKLAKFFQGLPGATVRDALNIQSSIYDRDGESDFGDDDVLIRQYDTLVGHLLDKLRPVLKSRLQDYPGLKAITLDTTSKDYTGPRWWMRRTLEDVLKNIIPLYTHPVAAYMDRGWEDCPLDYQDVADYGENFRTGSVLCMRGRGIPDTEDSRAAIRKLLNMRDAESKRRFRHIDIVGNPVTTVDFAKSLTDDERAGLIYLPIDYVTDSEPEHAAYYELDYALTQPDGWLR